MRLSDRERESHCVTEGKRRRQAAYRSERTKDEIRNTFYKSRKRGSQMRDSVTVFFFLLVGIQWI